MRLKLSSKARQESVDVRRWYRQRSKDTARQFDAELRAALARIRTNPLQYQVQDELGNRMVLVHHFPYKVVYRLDPGMISVVAVSHTSRDEYWKGR